MTVRRLILLVGAVALAAGVMALLVPVSVSGTNGNTISCGNAVASNLNAAREADGGSLQNIPVISQLVPRTNENYCQTSLSHRRAWSIPLAVIGVVVLAGALVVRGPRTRVPTTGGGV
jgi:uncharacterized protein (UPF0333 family)